jgi:RNA polymerase I specific transcription initiation factor RRN3
LQHIFVHQILKENTRKGLIPGFLKHETNSTSERTGFEVNEMVEINSLGNRENGAGVGEDLPRDWFPFDPYVLPRSKGFVTECFLEYMPVNEEDDEDMITDGEETGESERE